MTDQIIEIDENGKVVAPKRCPECDAPVVFVKGPGPNLRYAGNFDSPETPNPVGAALEAGPSPIGFTPIQELAQAAQNYLSAEAHVGVTHEMLRELNHRLGSLAGPHLIAYEAIAPRNSGNAVLRPPQEKPRT